jgi:sulfur transfer protein SufE
VEHNAIQHTLKPGWQWTYSYNQIIQYGKRLKAQLDASQPQPAPIHL